MHYVIQTEDKPNAFDLRAATRPAHLDYLKKQNAILLAAGPFLDDEDRMIGSLLIVDVASEAEARAFAENDPFAKAGLFSSTAIRKWRWSVGAPAKG
jgi:uncharacterized protein YciI